MELFDGLLIITKILLATDENDRKSLAEVEHFGNPLEVFTCQHSLIVHQENANIKRHGCLPSLERYRVSRASRRRSRLGSHGSLGMREAGDGHNLLVQRYPIGLARRAFHQLQHRQHSSRKLLGHRPKELNCQPTLLSTT